MAKRVFLLFTALFFTSALPAAPNDTLGVMVYNLLFYGHYTSFCTPGNNNTDKKDEYLSTIFDHTLPDIFAVFVLALPGFALYAGIRSPRNGWPGGIIPAGLTGLL